MDANAHYHNLPNMLMAAGSVFPLLALLSGLISIYEAKVNQRHCSPIFIPFFSPLLWDAGLLLLGTRGWVLLLPWVLDMGTLAFLFMMPHLIREWWDTSRWTRTHTLKGTHEDQVTTLTLHHTGKYILRKEWHWSPLERKQFRVDTVRRAVSEPGELSLMGENAIHLRAHTGRLRILNLTASGQYKVIEANISPDDYSLQGWVLHPEPKEK